MPKQIKIIQVTWITSIVSLTRQFLYRIWWDRITVYAAQASFFVIISAVPFFSLTVRILGLLFPSAAARENILIFLTGAVPDTVLQLISQLLAETVKTSPVSALSLSALMIWWSAAKGVGAVRDGIQTVYKSPRTPGYFRKMLRSAAYTVSFVLLVAAIFGILLFGEQILSLLQTEFQISLPLLHTLLKFKAPFFLLFLTFIFSLLYYTAARRSHTVNRHFHRHIPGAAFAALGWVIFSLAYSFYLNRSTRPQILYGSLTALCLVMLWVYFCMIILLCGAEINKMFFAKK